MNLLFKVNRVLFFIGLGLITSSCGDGLFAKQENAPCSVMSKKNISDIAGAPVIGSERMPSLKSQMGCFWNFDDTHIKQIGLSVVSTFSDKGGLSSSEMFEATVALLAKDANISQVLRIDDGVCEKQAVIVVPNSGFDMSCLSYGHILQVTYIGDWTDEHLRVTEKILETYINRAY